MNWFWGDVVLVSSNMTYRDENSIIDQIYQKQIFLDVYYEDLKFKNDWRKSIFKKYNTLQQETHKIGFQWYSDVSMDFRIILWKFQIIMLNIFAKPPKKLFDYDCITLYVCFIILLNLFLSLPGMKSRHLKLLDNPPV